MSEIIDDGRGRGYKASVSSTNRLNVSSKSNPRMYYNSRVGEAFSFISKYSAADGDQVIYFRNDNQDKNFVVTGIWVSSDNAGTFDFQKVTGTGAGTSIDGRQLNFTSGNTANATALGNAAVTGLNVEYIFAEIRCPQTATVPADFSSALILGKNNAIAVKYNGTAGNVSVVIGGHFEMHDNGVN